MVLNLRYSLTPLGEFTRCSISHLSGIFGNSLQIAQRLNRFSFPIYFFQGCIHAVGQLAQSAGLGAIGDDVDILFSSLAEGVALGTILHRFGNLLGGHGPLYIGAYFVGDGLGSAVFDFCRRVGQFFLCRIGDVLGREAAVTSYGRGLVSAYRGAQVGFVVFRHITSYGFRQGSFHGIALVAIDRSALAAISFRHSSFDAFRLAATDGIGLVSCYHIRLISAYI
ncbi:hypothetical protein, partial [uncultured Mitsuokella sp.]|uniref:hypothetical protein n=1 Tax=uncultured Mitsuokella sp. TaxID=453120 RepID=UPI00258C7014